MKMKEVSVYLSVLAFLQVILLTAGGGLISEISKPDVNVDRIFVYAIVALALIIAIVTIYAGVFNGAKRKK